MSTEDAEDAEKRAELDLRREGRWALSFGLALAAADIAIAATFRAALDRPLPYELFFAAMGCACLAIAHGTRERTNRDFRNVIRQVLHRLDEVEQVVAKVPDYSIGFIEGVEVSKRVSAEGD